MGTQCMVELPGVLIPCEQVLVGALLLLSPLQGRGQDFWIAVPLLSSCPDSWWAVLEFGDRGLSGTWELCKPVVLGGCVCCLVELWQLLSAGKLHVGW